MSDRDIDDVLKRAADAPHSVDPALLDRVSKSIGASLRPVRPLPPTWILTIALTLICAAVSIAGAAQLGFHGIQKMSVAQMALIIPTLAALIWLSAVLYVRQMIPGSPYRVAPWMLTAIGCAALIAAFALVFPDYQVERFVPQGLKCLITGLLYAIPAAIASWLLLRRGFAVNPLAAGLACGALAGLAGVGMLELHCPNFEAPHVMLWHTAVLPLSAAAGAIAARRLRTRRRNPA